jgi:protein AroM
MLPSSGQVPQARRRWGEVAAKVTVVGATPYAGGGAVEAAAGELGRARVDLVVMDCMGYTQAMRAAVREATGVPVLLARNVVARVVAEVVG